MVFNQSDSTAADFDHYYATNNYYTLTETVGAGSYAPNECERYERIYRSIDSVVKSGPRVVVDVGSAQGGFLYYCKEHHGAKPMAIEKSTSCQRSIQENLGIECLGDISELDGRAVDVVVLSHLLEHLYNPVEFLEQILRHTTQETFYYIEVPNALDYLGEGECWRQLYYEHINHFDVSHLTLLLERVGLVVEQIDTIPFDGRSARQNECVAVVCHKGNTIQPVDQQLLCTQAEHVLLGKKRFVHHIESVIDENHQRIAIWGISQYIQLLLGMVAPLRNKTVALFDRSPAKCGRVIDGLTIMSPEAIADLNDYDLVLLSKGPYSDEICKQLEILNFSGDVVAV